MASKKKPLDNVLPFQRPELSLAMYQMASQIEDLKVRQKNTCEMAAKAILNALDLKDHYTFGHSMRVTYYSLVLGKFLKFSPEELYVLELSAMFHDIGKIGTPDSVLLKPSRLDEPEFLIMKEHPVKSFEILSDISDFEEIARFAKHHHERYDGRGYPEGLKGEKIPIYSRIILIADTFDAMTSTRPYREGLPYSVAFNELKQFSGSQFDPYLVKKFIDAMKIEESKNENTFFLPILKANFSKKAA